MDPNDIAANDDPHIFGKSDIEDDGTAELIRKIMEDDDDEDDDGGFDQPPVDRESDLPDVVEPDEGHDLLDKASLNKGKGDDGEEDEGKAASEDQGGTKKRDAAAAPAAKTSDAAENAEGEGDPAKADEGNGGASPLTEASVSDLLEGVADDRRAEISRRLDEATGIMSVFDNHKDELSRHNTTPKAALERLVDLNAFAQQKPDEYIAWVSKEMGGDKPMAALEGAAKLLGMKLVKEEPAADEDDEDEFMTDREREQAATIRELKAQNNQPREFGPDTTARATEQSLHNFINEVDPATGQKVRPHFDLLHPHIARMAMEARQSNGRNVTVDDLQTFYDKALSDMQAALGTAPTPQPVEGEQPATPAAQDADTVQKTIQKKAAAAAKAQKASKSIDGTGQGASRRPALPPDASIDAVIRHFADSGAD